MVAARQGVLEGIFGAASAGEPEPDYFQKVTVTPSKVEVSGLALAISARNVRRKELAAAAAAAANLAHVHQP
jgi:hypothetical protein